jgi:hypothetical protein
MPDPNGDLDVAAIPSGAITEVRDQDFILDAGDSFETISHWYSRQDVFPHTPMVQDVKQRGIGDCWLLAALHCILDSDPGLICGMMRDLRGGWVVVRLYHEGNPIYYKIEKSNLTNRTVQVDGHGAPWVYMVEKAYAAYRLRVLKVEVKPKTWVKEDGVLKCREGAKRRARTYREALSNGHTDDALKALLNGAVLRVTIDDERRNSAAAVGLFDLFTLRDLTDIREGQRTALQEAFGSETSVEARDLVANFDIRKFMVLSEMRDNYGEKTVRRDQIKRFLDSHYGGLQPSTRQKLDAYIDALFPGKRGTKQYTAQQENLFKQIQAALAARVLVAVASGSVLGKDKKMDSFGLTSEHKVKGVAGPHAYQVVNCFMIDDVKYVKLRNPWGFYGRAYDEATDPRTGQQILKAKEDERPLEPGVFRLELTDLTKRFGNVYFRAEADQVLQAVRNA